jgi:nicotinate-nucleotide adenylyltransferase
MIRAVLGGSFDPVHLGHVALSRHLLDHRLADLLVVVPAWLSPHKDENSATPADRLTMVELAFAGMGKVEVDRREIDRRRLSFSIETLRELADEHPQDRLRLVIGGDNLAGFSTWREHDRIQAIAEVIVYPRDGVVPTPAAISAGGLDPARVIPVTDFAHPVSSTTVRAILAEGIEPRDQLPAAVADFIASRQLYSR